MSGPGTTHTAHFPAIVRECSAKCAIANTSERSDRLYDLGERFRQADLFGPSAEVRAGCVSGARTDLCGGRLAMAVPTATDLIPRVLHERRPTIWQWQERL
jgi:hypothetical protein